MSPANAVPRVVEKHYSARELSFLVGFDAKFWRQQMKSQPELLGANGELISNCVEISGEFFAPASWVNAFLSRRPLRYDAGIKARNTAELRRKMNKASPEALPAAA